MKKIIILLVLIAELFAIKAVSAANCCNSGELNDPAGCIPCISDPLTGKSGKVSGDSINVLIGKIINGVLGIVGSLALVMFIYGGFVWMTARGNREAITKGKDILIWAVIGLVVIFTSYAAVRFVLTNIVAGTTTGNPAPIP